MRARESEQKEGRERWSERESERERERKREVCVGQCICISEGHMMGEMTPPPILPVFSHLTTDSSSKNVSETHSNQNQRDSEYGSKFECQQTFKPVRVVPNL